MSYWIYCIYYIVTHEHHIGQLCLSFLVLFKRSSFIEPIGNHVQTKIKITSFCNRSYVGIGSNLYCKSYFGYPSFKAGSQIWVPISKYLLLCELNPTPLSVSLFISPPVFHFLPASLSFLSKICTFIFFLSNILEN